MKIKRRSIYAAIVSSILSVILVSPWINAQGLLNGTLDPRFGTGGIDAKHLPYKFRRPPAPRENTLNSVTGPTLAGSLDPMFGMSGKTTTDFSSIDYATAVAVQADGKTVAAGSAIAVDNSSYYDYSVFRYNADGSLDASFGTNGKVTTNIGNSYPYYDVAWAVAIQTNGKIICAGSSGDRFSMVRYNIDGSLDNSFGSGGKVLTESLYGAIFEIAVQADGKIVAAGTSFTIVRYDPNGSLDPSFGTGGIVMTNFNPDETQSAYSVVVQADGKVVAAGDTGFCEKEACFFDFALARYNTDGSLDTSFDGDGKVTTQFGANDETASSTAVVLQADGKIVAAGSFYSPVAAPKFALVRYHMDGSLDASFDADGRVLIEFGGYIGANAVALQSNGNIIAAGHSDGDFSLTRLNGDGSLDTSFDADGKVTTDFGNVDAAYDIAIQADGRIAAVGSSLTYTVGDYASDFALSRYNADGSLDAAFDADGKVTTSFLDVSSAANAVVINERIFDPCKTVVAGYSNDGTDDDFSIATYVDGRNCSKRIIRVGNLDDRANAVGIDPSNRIVAAGYTNNGSDTDFAVVRLNDITFGGDGIVTTDFEGHNDEARAVVVQPNYKIVVVGQTIINGNGAVAVARYNTNGSLDDTFSTDGKVISQAVHEPTAMAIQPDGKIIVAGNDPHPDPPFGSDFALARFNPDGSLDTTFDGDGVAVTQLELISRINSVALQPYGKIVAAGTTGNTTQRAFALARYNTDGSLDTSFDTDGKVTTSFGTPSSEANAVRVQRNGKIVAVGSTLSTSSILDFALARYNSNGSLDTTFDTDGKQTTDFFGEGDSAFAADVQRDGKIVAAGSARRGEKYDFASARYIGDATAAKVSYDFDDDGLADISVFRPSDGVWYIDRSTEGLYGTQFGISDDQLAPADFDGDGKTDIAVFRNGTWYFRTSYDPLQFGSPGDIALPADYNGDGQAELTIYRGGLWWSYNLRTQQAGVIQFGLATDRPVPADYDGDGRVDQAVYRDGVWHLNRSSLGYTAIHFGLAADRPVAADYDGDSKADLAVYRDGTWYLLQSTDGFTAFQWGLAKDIPVPADYDGDGKTDLAVYRNDTWYLLKSNGGFSAVQFGLIGDKPVPSAYLH